MAFSSLRFVVVFAAFLLPLAKSAIAVLPLGCVVRVGTSTGGFSSGFCVRSGTDYYLVTCDHVLRPNPPDTVIFLPPGAAPLKEPLSPERKWLPHGDADVAVLRMDVQNQRVKQFVEANALDLDCLDGGDGVPDIGSTVVACGVPDCLPAVNKDGVSAPSGFSSYVVSDLLWMEVIFESGPEMGYYYGVTPTILPGLSGGPVLYAADRSNGVPCRIRCCGVAKGAIGSLGQAAVQPVGIVVPSRFVVDTIMAEKSQRDDATR